MTNQFLSGIMSGLLVILKTSTIVEALKSVLSLPVLLALLAIRYARTSKDISAGDRAIRDSAGFMVDSTYTATSSGTIFSIYLHRDYKPITLIQLDTDSNATYIALMKAKNAPSSSTSKRLQMLGYAEYTAATNTQIILPTDFILRVRLRGLTYIKYQTSLQLEAQAGRKLTNILSSGSRLIPVTRTLSWVELIKRELVR